MAGVFITFEGTEGSGKSTQIGLLADFLRSIGKSVRSIREPGGTPIGEEIRHTLKHSPANDHMTWEAELLLMNASRAQLVREVIRPALAENKVVLCDRYYDSSIAYQGYGRQLDLARVKTIIDFAVGETKPDLTVLFRVPPEVSAERLLARQSTLPFMRDRMEEADRTFFLRVAKGYEELAAAEPRRIRQIDAVGAVARIQENIRKLVLPVIERKS
jgi:dTMP kinase